MFSKACEYAIRAAIYIAAQSLEGRRVGLKEIAKDIDSPEAFTAKILQELSRCNIIDSTKGPTGGFYIAPKNQLKIKLKHIVSAIDGDKVFTGCGLGLKECSEREPCPVHDRFKIIRQELSAMLNATTIGEMAVETKDGLKFLKR
ncbi:MAG: RrF2 family transcriptional regulator [Bacteroidia bacterium]